jgi:hypothetical protein
MITIEKQDDTTFNVTIKAGSVTTHRVTVNPSYYEKLTGGNVSPEKLVEKSFEFLLQRESNTSILSSFDLPVISHYFPEYESKIKTMLNL